MKLAIGCDHAGFAIKNAVQEHLAAKGHTLVDVGTNSADSCHYPVYADALCKKILEGECEMGILICGTGVGISIAANKVRGIRCACVSEPVSARLCRAHNNCNMIAFGERIIGVEMAKAIVDAFLNTEAEGGRHAERVELIMKLEREQTCG